MEYTKKHKNLIAKLFKKAGMLEEASIVLSCDDYKYEIANAMQDAATKANVPIGSTSALLDAARRYENRNCAIFKECTLPRCEGGVWCNIYNLGIPSRQGGKFYGKFISDILHNKMYLGILVWNKRHYDTKSKTRNGEGKGYRYVNNDPSKVIEVPNTHEPIITQKEFDEAQALLKRNRTNSVVRFRNNVYHLSGILKCNECSGNYRGMTATVNHRTKMRRPWYRCSSKGISYIKCNNKSVTADAINKQVWDIIETIRRNIHVLEELGDMIKLSVSEPEQELVKQLEDSEASLKKNLDKQKGLYELFSEDKINIDIYKERAELLRNEEKKIRQDVKAIQLKILEKRNAVNLVKETQNFLLRLRSNPNKE